MTFIAESQSAGTEPVVLKVVPVTGAAILQVTVDQLMCASLFPHPLYCCWYEIGIMLKEVRCSTGRVMTYIMTLCAYYDKKSKKCLKMEHK